MDTNTNNKSIKLKMGTFSTLATVFAIAIMLLVNMIFQNLDIYYDLTPDRRFSISEKSHEVLAEMDAEIKIYTLSKSGEEVSLYQQYLMDYKAYPNIEVENIDPYININFAELYSQPGETLPINTVIVTSGDRYKVIYPHEMYTSTFDVFTAQDVVDSITIEYRLTNAIRYVAHGENNKIYFITSHNEVPLSENYKKYFTDANYDLIDLPLVNVEAIPEDAGALFITTPLRDYNDQETQIVMDYLEGGGRVVMFVDYTGEDYANLRKIANYYGVTFEENVILEGNSSYLMPLTSGQLNPFAILPRYNEHEIVAGLEQSDYKVGITNARPLYRIDIKRQDLTIDPFLVTSTASYLKDLENYETLNIETGDEQGPFAVAVAITDESVSSSKPAKLVVAGTSAFIADELNNGANSNIVISMFNWACERMANIYIEPKVITSTMLNITSMDQVYRIGAISIFAVPGAIMVTGVAVWLRRRNR